MTVSPTYKAPTIYEQREAERTQRFNITGGVGVTTHVISTIRAADRPLLITSLTVVDSTSDAAWYSIDNNAATWPNAEVEVIGPTVTTTADYGVYSLLDGGQPFILPAGKWLNISLYDAAQAARTGQVYIAYLELR